MTGETIIPRFRLRFSLKAMVIVVLLGCIGLTSGILVIRWYSCVKRAYDSARYAEHLKRETMYLADVVADMNAISAPVRSRDHFALELLQKKSEMEYCKKLSEKYYAAAHTPWKSVEPDPPRPWEKP